MNLLRWALSYVDSSARRASESISGGGPPSDYEQLGEIQDQNMSFEPLIRKRLLEELERFIVNGEEQKVIYYLLLLICDAYFNYLFRIGKNVWLLNLTKQKILKYFFHFVHFIIVYLLIKNSFNSFD